MFVELMTRGPSGVTYATPSNAPSRFTTAASAGVSGIFIDTTRSPAGASSSSVTATKYPGATAASPSAVRVTAPTYDPEGITRGSVSVNGASAAPVTSNSARPMSGSQPRKRNPPRIGASPPAASASVRRARRSAASNSCAGAAVVNTSRVPTAMAGVRAEPMAVRWEWARSASCAQ